MNNFIVDKRLQADSIFLGAFPLSQVRLMNNTLFPWFILVPCVAHNEIHQLERQQQIQLLDEITTISHFIECRFNTDKINIGAIGNIVRQLHVHVVGRMENDHCWPNVVWGVKEKNNYTHQQTAVIADDLTNYFSQQAKLVYISKFN